MKYIKNFTNQSEYETFLKGEEFITPNVSYANEENEVYFLPLVLLPAKYGELEFTFAEGMTWGAFINSEYNTVGLKKRFGKYVGQGDTIYSVSLDNVIMPYDEETGVTNVMFQVQTGEPIDLIYYGTSDNTGTLMDVFKVYDNVTWREYLEVDEYTDKEDWSITPDGYVGIEHKSTDVAGVETVGYQYLYKDQAYATKIQADEIMMGTTIVYEGPVPVL